MRFRRPPSSQQAIWAPCRYPHWSTKSQNMKNGAGAYSRALCRSMVCHAEVRQGLSSNWLESSPEGVPDVGSYGRVFDVTVLGRSEPTTTLEAGLFESGRPVLIAPPMPRPQMGTNVLVAWNGSTEQARAIAFAMPILERARRVIVLTVEGGAGVPGPTGEQVCRSLQFNGVPARPLTVGLDGRLTGEAILAHANALGCDLLIKGAYTQSRLRQLIFGGTTRYILNNAELPVLMAH